MLARSALIDGMEVVSADYAHKGGCVVLRVPHKLVYTGTVYASSSLKQESSESDRIDKDAILAVTVNEPAGNFSIGT
jgi:hypothetical protein